MRVAVADDSLIVRAGLVRMLEGQGIEVVAEAEDGEDLIRYVALRRPDVAIVDIRMPPTHTDEGLRAATAIRERYSETGVLVLSQYAEPEYAAKLLDAHERRSGYLLKEKILDAERLADSVRRIGRGETVVDPALVRALMSDAAHAGPMAELTEREREILALMAEGLTDHGIADRLVVSPRTVDTHIRHIFQKLELPSGARENRRVHAVLTYLHHQ